MFLFTLILALAADTTATPSYRQTVAVVVGADGEPQFGEQFTTWAERWKKAAEESGSGFHLIRQSKNGRQSKEQLRLLLEAEAAHPHDAEPFWLIFIGHGTFNQRTTKFNLNGPDISAQELAVWLDGVPRRTVIINTSSSSGPFINTLSKRNRVVLTATKSGAEHNFARFGDFLSLAVANPSADLDKDDQTSLLEAFLYASAAVDEYYRQQGRLVTEHALLDDNGDARGAPASLFNGLRAVRKTKDNSEIDGLQTRRLHLNPSAFERSLPADILTRRDTLEAQLAALRKKKASLSTDDYYQQLEQLLLPLAKLYERMPEEKTLSKEQPSPRAQQPDSTEEKTSSGR